MVFCKQRFDFVLKTTVEKLKKKVLREKYCQQKRGKWAIETKQAAYNKLR